MGLASSQTSEAYWWFYVHRALRIFQYITHLSMESSCALMELNIWKTPLKKYIKIKITIMKMEINNQKKYIEAKKSLISHNF